MNNRKVIIDESLVSNLITKQFPQWQDLSIHPVALSGWDNRTFRLGDEMIVRMPSSAEYAGQVEIEQRVLTNFASLLPLPIPIPIALGEPNENYPWKWSIYRYLSGEPATVSPIANLDEFASKLAQFLVTLHCIPTKNGPSPGPFNFYRGGPLITYDDQTRKAITLLKDKIDSKAAIEIWNTAIATKWDRSPVWVHGDINASNLLVWKGQLNAVIDFGQVAIGDPACDLAIAWTFFSNSSRKLFYKEMLLDADTWARGRAWALWKALILAAEIVPAKTTDVTQSWRIIADVLED